MTYDFSYDLQAFSYDKFFVCFVAVLTPAQAFAIIWRPHERKKSAQSTQKSECFRLSSDLSI